MTLGTVQRETTGDMRWIRGGIIIGLMTTGRRTGSHLCRRIPGRVTGGASCTGVTALQQKSGCLIIMGKGAGSPLIGRMAVSTNGWKIKIGMGGICRRIILNQMTGLTGFGSRLMSKYGGLPGILSVTGFTEIFREAGSLMIRSSGSCEIIMVTGFADLANIAPLSIYMAGEAVVG